MFVKIYFYKLAFTLKHYKLMWQYLISRKLEGGSKYFSPFNLRDLFDQNGMDFATEISLCKTPVVDEKMLILQ